MLLFLMFCLSQTKGHVSERHLRAREAPRGSSAKLEVLRLQQLLNEVKHIRNDNVVSLISGKLCIVNLFVFVFCLSYIFLLTLLLMLFMRSYNSSWRFETAQRGEERARAREGNQKKIKQKTKQKNNNNKSSFYWIVFCVENCYFLPAFPRNIKHKSLHSLDATKT